MLREQKATAKLPLLFQWPNVILEDCLLTVLNVLIYTESAVTAPAVVSFVFAIFSLLHKLSVHWPFLRACCCKRCVNADAKEKLSLIHI